jgi:DNA-binding beta-propeller fold protein YncE
MKFLRLTFIFSTVVFILHSCAPAGDPVLPKATHLYFSDFTGKRIGVIDLNNLKSATTLADETDGLDTVAGIAIDFVGGKIYAAEELNDRIVRINLDGSGSVETLYQFLGDSVLEPTAVTFDAENNKLYWANSGTGQIKSGTMDGTGDVAILFDSTKVLNYSYGLVYEPISEQLVFSDFGENASVRVGAVDGGANQAIKLFYPGFALRSPAQINLFAAQSRVYWADESLGTLSVGNLTSNATQIIYDDEDGIERADGIAVDFGSQKIYWTDTSKKVIMRANLDGTGEQEVVLENIESYSIILRFDNQ